MKTALLMTLYELEARVKAALDPILPGVVVKLHPPAGNDAPFDVEIEPPDEVQKMLYPKRYEAGLTQSFHYCAYDLQKALDEAKGLVEDLAHDYEHFCRAGSLPMQRRVYLDRFTMGDEKTQQAVFASQRSLLTERRDAVMRQLAEHESIADEAQLKKLMDLVTDRLEEACTSSGEVDRDQYVRLIVLNYVGYKRGWVPPVLLGPARLRLYDWIDRELRRLQ